MMLEPGLEQETFKLLLEKCREQNKPVESMQRLKAKAWEHYLALGLPTKKNEAYRYIKLRQLFSQTYQPGEEIPLTENEIEQWILPESKQSVLVFVNGFFQPQLSNTDALPSKIFVSTIEEALSTFGAFINNQWSKGLKEETDSFAVLNAALHTKGAFLYIPPKCRIEAPIQILHIIDSSTNPSLLIPRLQLFVGSHAQVEVVHTQHHLSDQSYFVNMASEWAIEEGASVHYVQAQCNEHHRSWHFEAFRAVMKRDSKLTVTCATQGSLSVRNDYRVALTGENAEATLNSVSMLPNKQESHAHIFMDHQAPHCRSFQLFKSVLKDFSRSAFEGKIMVRREAQKTEAFQLNNNLILDDHAHADSKPNLEIFADDVKASHGATVGQLDPDQLFYMKTRGFTDAQAKNLLILGFCEQVIQTITIPSLKSAISFIASSFK